MSIPGHFVVLEGGDASGKSTEVAALVTRLREHGLEVEATFEPGATPLGEQLRGVLLNGAVAIDPVAEALLMAADRAEHVAEVIRPALARGTWVVSDRFVPSSLAYQGVGRGLGVVEVEVINSMAVGGIEADLVVVLDVPPDVARARLGERRDRLEGEDDAFALAVHEAYRDLAANRGWPVVDAGASEAAVADAVWTVVREELLDE